MTQRRSERRWLPDNGLTIVLLGLFLLSLAGHAAMGWQTELQDRAQHGEAALGFLPYLGSGEFLSSLFENWESEFLQMGAYVVLTAYLVQRGSPESKDPDEAAPQDEDPSNKTHDPAAPWPVRRGGVWLRLYSHSLGLALFALFIASFILHWLNSARAAADLARAHGQIAKSSLAYLGDAQLWFESFQNWQSEFLSTALIVVLGIWLREKGSPESKAVADPHRKTGA